MNRVRVFGTAIVVLSAAGVSAALASQRSATVAPAIASSILAAPQADEHTYSVDTVHSSVVFRIDHSGIAPFYGVFNEFSGTYQFDPDNPEKASFEITVKADSVDTRNEGRDNHVKSADFFNVTEYPEMTFKSTSVKASGKNLKVTGDLTFHGQTKPVNVDMIYMGKSEGRRGVKTGFDVQFTFKRSEFGVDHYVAEGGLGDEIKMLIGLEGAKQ